MKPTRGSHLSFPFGVGDGGRMGTVASEEQHVRDELQQLLMTHQGERLFAPEIGGGMRQFVFENLGDPSMGLMQSFLVDQITRWLGHRLILNDLKVSRSEATLRVEIIYQVKATGTQDTMTFNWEGAGT